MPNNRAVPQGYRTVGEVAKKNGRHHPHPAILRSRGSTLSIGGRRLYTDKDWIKLHQILSMKPLWYSLDDIQNRLVSLDTPAEVADALAEQAASIRQKKGSLAVTPAAAALLCFPSAEKTGGHRKLSSGDSDANRAGMAFAMPALFA